MGLGEVSVQYQVVTKTKTPALQVIDLERTVEDQEEFLRVAIGVMRGVDNGVFVPVRSWACKGSPFARVCRPTPLRIPDQGDHGFRGKPITHSGGRRSPIPEQADR